VARVELKPLPPEEAVRFFERKYDLRGFDWRDVWQHEHAAAFTVAKAMRMDILADIRAATLAAIRDGTTFRDFQQQLEPLLRSKGWWGRQRMTDPATGETRIVQLGSPRRLRTIFDTNLRTAHAAGRWERIQRVKDRRPYLRYVAVLDDATRPEHRRWHGTVLPADDPWWRTHYPPNGWGCRCAVQQLSERDLQRLGIKLSRRPATRPRPWRNRRTGETIRVPDGIDPGFAYNVGRAAAENPGQVLARKIDAAPPDIARAAVADVVAGRAFERFVRRPDGVTPVGVLDERLGQAIGTTAQAVRLSADTAGKQLRHHPDLSAEDYRRIQAMIERGEAVRQGERHLVLTLTDQGRPYLAVVKATQDGRELYLVSYHRARRHHVRRARERGEVVRRGI
jgi:SPP1 gp7 family putative phage head morphogenesis protein